MKIGLAQLNATVGDFVGNAEAVRRAYRRATEEALDVLICPELMIPGYPPRDLLCRSGFIGGNLRALESLAGETGRVGLVVGFVGRHDHRGGRDLTNSVALLMDGKVVAIRSKTLLPSYDVFDEDRYFEPATENRPVTIAGETIGLTICEDVWNDEDFWTARRYARDPIQSLVQAGVRIIVNASASPWHFGKDETREGMLRTLAKNDGVWVCYCNLVGGNDELVFDGRSMVFDPQGRMVAQGRQFDEDFLVVDTESAGPVDTAAIDDPSQLHGALVLGVKDYLRKCGFRSAVLGLSGGIDSAVTVCLAVDALGAENVRGVAMPSQYSSQGSLDDAEQLARTLGIGYDVVPIQPPFEALRGQLAPLFEGRQEDVTEENMQARLRGVILMALSNKFGSLLLTTGNKSELAVGYCTLYGDMCGGLAVISDVPKTWVYRLARWLNRDGERIPESSITKPPSAELRPDQKDLDSLPPYEMLDEILDRYVVQHQSLAEIVDSGLEDSVVRRIVRLIDLNEYKRRQAAPGIKVTSKAFGMGRRIPIARHLES